MDDKHMCDKELLVGYLYDELDPAAKRAFEAHLAGCADCGVEVESLRSTRTRILAWAPPEGQFDYRIVRGAAAPPAAPRARFAPAWGLAAAAVLVLAAAAAIANVEVRYDGSGVVMRTGWSRPAEPAVAAQAAAPAPPADALTAAQWKAQVDVLDRRLRDLEAAAPSRTQPVSMQTGSGPRMSDAEVLRRVREMVGQSETRQQRELVTRVRQLIQDFDARRRTDMATIQQGFGQLQGATGVEAAQHREIMNYLRLVSQQK